jgi:hypothetical protein
MPALKHAEVASMEPIDARDEAAVVPEPEEIKFGEDSKFVQISINISFPFSSIVIPAGCRAGGGFFEFVRRAVPQGFSTEASAEKEATPRSAGRPAA